jgi:hypothetical protein
LRSPGEPGHRLHSERRAAAGREDAARLQQLGRARDDGGLRAPLHPAVVPRWSEWRVANTAFGAASFLILEAVGATLLVQHGFVNAALAILATGLVIFLPACRSASTRRATASTWTC